ncbi:MAG TPA: YfiR family protein [Polyangiaceae bacterium]|nr:YfiR family protein [Polyangiaceae bacterium]
MRGRRLRQSLGRWLSGVGLALLVICSSLSVGAEDVAVPISLQMNLLLKVASYDKNLKQRAGDRVRVAVVVRSNDPDSGRSAAQALKALAETEDVEGLPLDRISMTYTDAAGLARFTHEGNVSILYVTPGFSETEIDAMARALDGVSVLSAGALAKYTPLGMVLGFDLAGGKPKLIVNLGRAKRQNVELSSSVLKLVRVIE